MPPREPVTPLAEQLLGEIETRIVGMQYYDAAVNPGDAVHLEREPNNKHDANAMRVENGLFEPVGHVPRRVCSWLARLIDDGKVRVDGSVPTEKSGVLQGHEIGAASGSGTICPLTLTVFLCPKGKSLLEECDPRTKLDALHQFVRQAYEQIQGYRDADLILEIAEGLKPLARQELLPETRLLLALVPGVAHEARKNMAVQATAGLRDRLATLELGAPLHHHNLTLFPLTWPDQHQPPYVLLGPAIDGGQAVVEEVNESGDVPNLRVVNRSKTPLLIPEGEILIGAKQNRVVNVTVLVAAESQFTVPVSCVEQGRWRYQSREFRSAYCAPPSLRSKKMRAVQRNRAARGTAESDQGQVWDEVAKGLDAVQARSETGSLTDGYEATKEELQKYRDQLSVPPGTAGVLVAHGDRVVGMDLFDSPVTLASLWERLSDAYFFDALRDTEPQVAARTEIAQQFLRNIAERAKPRVPSLGLGDELEITGDDMVGGALLYNDRICHLAAFSDVKGSQMDDMQVY